MLAGFLPGQSAVTAAQPGRIFGIVTDSNGKPLRGANVTLKTGGGARVYGTVQTSEDGRFEFVGLPVAEYDVTARGAPTGSPMMWGSTMKGIIVDGQSAAKVTLVLDAVLPLKPLKVVNGGHRNRVLQQVSDPPSVPARSQIIINQAGRKELQLSVVGNRLAGTVHGIPVQLDVNEHTIEGRIDGEPVLVWIRGQEAAGRMGGHDVGYSHTETAGGHLLSGTAVGHTVRFETSYGILSWLPGCEAPLLSLPRGRQNETVYQGLCKSRRRMRVTIPDTFEALPPMARLIVLSLLLTERDEVFSRQSPSLFPLNEEAR